ncbi:MAG: hypothetical protein E7Z91_07215 [Cyanobacteria bacterium SIG30]|nr:hypothetical protein [Cyanobacteria bacterium SIG30]
MLRISPIKNVNSTLNNRLTFKAGGQTNFGLEIESANKNIVEGGLLTGFAGIIQKSIEILNPKVVSRAKSIEAGINETKKFNKVA